jgi:hypothetical protein
MKTAALRMTSGRVYIVTLSRGRGPAWLTHRLRQRAPIEARSTIDGRDAHVVPSHVEAFTIEEHSS